MRPGGQIIILNTVKYLLCGRHFIHLYHPIFKPTLRGKYYYYILQIKECEFSEDKQLTHDYISIKSCSWISNPALSDSRDHLLN